MKSVENCIAQTERLLNPIDWVPYFASISGMVRVLAGMVEIAAAMAFAYAKVIHNLITHGQMRLSSAIRQGWVYGLHGAANIVRGTIAIHPWCNLLLAVHDWKLGRYNYPLEKVPEGVYPLGTRK